VAVPIVGASGTVDGVTEFEGALAGPDPFIFEATTVNVYAVPLVSPVTTIGLAAPEAEPPAGFEVTVYPVIADPPLLAGAENVTEACAFPFVAVPIVGALGTAEGVIEFEAALAGPSPLALVATTVKVYAVPLMSPVTRIGLAAPEAEPPAGFEVTV
jgi:hypothetical protein